jgi:hypothetical protein
MIMADYPHSFRVVMLSAVLCDAVAFGIGEYSYAPHALTAYYAVELMILVAALAMLAQVHHYSVRRNLRLFCCFSPPSSLLKKSKLPSVWWPY